ncbi:nucleotide-binding protein [Thermoplasmatales archaeon SW_10_69_26]|jgi:rRNA-processing protein FCF1|nr:MAG: nucleotide-binding protein [Thermoplasmatales archaeon SW_10_69_26]
MSEDEQTEPEVDEGEEDTPKRTVIVDANALMMQFQYHVDLEQELERVIPGAFDVIVPRQVLDELETKTERASGKEAEEARLGIELGETFEVAEIEGDFEKTDDAIVQIAADRDDTVVVTNDKLLRAQLRAQGVPNVHMRSKAFLTVEGFPGF